MGTQMQPGQTLMEYTGNQLGSASVRSRSKRVDGQLVRYWYGADARLVPVWDEDVAHMESIGFRRATAAPAPAPVEMAPTAPTFATERAAAAAPAMPFAHPTPPDEQPATIDASAVEALFNQGALQQQSEAKVRAAQEAIRRGRKPKG